MSLKYILILLLFTLVSTYIAFLNPHEVEVFISQNRSIHLPMVLLLFSFILFGVVVTVLLNWMHQFRKALKRSGDHFREKREKKKLRQFEQLYEKAENLVNAGRLDKAQLLLEGILENHPNHIGALFHLGNIMNKKGEREKALELHAIAARQAPENIKILSHLAEDYSAAGLPGKEIKALEAIKRFSADSPEVLGKMRDSYLKNKNWAQATQAQKRILSLANNEEDRHREQRRLSEVTYAKAIDHFENGHKDIGIFELKRAIKADSTFLPAHIRLGDVLLAAGEAKAALKAYKTAFEKTGSPVCLLRMEQYYTDAGQPEEMIQVYRNAIDKAADNGKETLTLILAKLLLGLGKAEEAIELLSEVARNGLFLHDLLLADAYLESNDTTGQAEKLSRSAYEKAIASFPAFTCSQCHAPAGQWQDHCPACHRLNSLTASINC
ncbi:MAG: tetratricopeptide repeat protein [Nitrospinaceae bacterium]|nr:MAG: tetratricopeptide repeat protein [Nitrospinaceae bacterium]